MMLLTPTISVPQWCQARVAGRRKAPDAVAALILPAPGAAWGVHGWPSVAGLR